MLSLSWECHKRYWVKPWYQHFEDGNVPIYRREDTWCLCTGSAWIWVQLWLHPSLWPPHLVPPGEVHGNHQAQYADAQAHTSFTVPEVRPQNLANTDVWVYGIPYNLLCICWPLYSRCAAIHCCCDLEVSPEVTTSKKLQVLYPHIKAKMWIIHWLHL